MNTKYKENIEFRESLETWESSLAAEAKEWIQKLINQPIKKHLLRLYKAPNTIANGDAETCRACMGRCL